MSNEEEKRCPLCAEEMDWTDIQLKPCKCGYQVCVWCWHHLIDVAEKDGTEGRCPACRTPYDKEKIVQMQTNCERVITKNATRKSKPTKVKTKSNEVKRDLNNVRVIQRKMAYVIGLPLSLADEDLLQRKEYFGQYGKISKVSLSRTAGGTVQEFINETCSVYVTYSKEEEALRCIQSVHGFMLEGRFLRASFGTAKYCHAWLRNMPCNNPSCLYLHIIGAEEDSFGKDEVAAVHTRSRVQQVVGVTHNLRCGSGSVLPPPIDELFNNCSASLEKSTANSIPEDAAYATVSSSSHLTSSSLLYIDRDGDRTPTKMTTFVDVVGRSSSFGSEKDGNISEDGKILNLCSEFCSVTIDKNNHLEAENSGIMLHGVASSSQQPCGLPRNREVKEPLRESSKFSLSRQADLTRGDTSITKQQSSLINDSGRQVIRGSYSTMKNDQISFDNQRMKDSGSLSQVSVFPSSYSSKSLQDCCDDAWQNRYSCTWSAFNADCDTVHNKAVETSVQFTSVNSMSNDGYSERKFQNSSKSDRIYRSSNSFSNEEIVEHLRRIDDKAAKFDENSAFNVVENSIISNILSMDFDLSDESFTAPQSSAALFAQNDRHSGSPWNFSTCDQSRFSFAKHEPFEGQITGPDSSFDNVSHLAKKSSIFLDSSKNKEQYAYNPQYLGISMPSREPPPGFSVCKRTNPVIHETSVGGSKSTIGLNKSGLVTRSTTSQPSISEDEARLWLWMQQAMPTHEEPKLSHIYMQQAPSIRKELRHPSQVGDEFSPFDDHYSVSSSLVDQHRTHNPPSFSHLSRQKFSNGHLSNSFQLGLNEVPHRSEVDRADIQRNGNLGLGSLYSGHGDIGFQMAGSGDVYTRVFGM